MKKLLIAGAVLASFNCYAALPKAPKLETVEFTDAGNIEAIVCKIQADAQQFIVLAANGDTAAFSSYINDKFRAQACKFMGSDAQIDVLAHSVVMTQNGPLWVIKLRQKDVYGKHEYWWSSANYFPTAYPKTRDWEFELIGSQFDHTDNADDAK